MIISHAILTYKKYSILLALLLGSSIVSLATEYSIVFIHLGSTIPAYLPIALEQSRLFNPEAEIVLIANTDALATIKYDFNTFAITTITCESLPTTSEHRYFSTHTQLNKTFREGFWQYASERFYYLHEFIKHHKKNNVFHLEYDNMLYVDLALLLNFFRSEYQNVMGVVFDNDVRGIASFMYIPNEHVINRFVSFINNNLFSQYNDMELLGLFKNHCPEYVKNLPIIPECYAQQHALISTKGHRVAHPYNYYQYATELEGIFDAAALGQYLGGIDPRNGPSAPKFINESCIFNPSYFTFLWELDTKGRIVPYAVCNNIRSRIFNLHIHSKNLAQFTSNTNLKR
jgi:hypothetical protein